jgi:DNA-binding NtrC family response regulator
MTEDQSSDSRGKTILVVDDDPDILKLLKQILQDDGYTVIAANNPFRGLQFAELFREKIDLLLTDVVMPDMDGFALSKNVKMIIPDIKVLFISGYTAEIIGKRNNLIEGFNFIRKPFSCDALCSAVFNNIQAIQGSAYNSPGESRLEPGGR